MNRVLPQAPADVARQVDHFEWLKTHFPNLYADEVKQAETPAPHRILLAGIDLLKQHGRAFGSYDNQQGELCALGALAVAANKDAECWESMRGSWPLHAEPGDRELVEAARELYMVLAGADVSPEDLQIEDLIEGVGAWHDGTPVPDSEEAIPPANSVVFAAFSDAAARLAEQAGAAHAQ
ncbi:hypothetical protein ACBJ59_36270 [Nonomuraea sp. MTCD27]|uniref:hypothetical protein n=1 Tax=Nonomuraea sp. MTCD27 TaxID=1676747 RepID=UPI0035BF620E